MANFADECILEMKTGKKLLFSRFISINVAQVHDGANILAEMTPVYFGKRGQNYCVQTFAEREGETRRQLSATYHGKIDSAEKAMRRRAITEYRARLDI